MLDMIPGDSSTQDVNSNFIYSSWIILEFSGKLSNGDVIAILYDSPGYAQAENEGTTAL